MTSSNTMLFSYKKSLKDRKRSRNSNYMFTSCFPNSVLHGAGVELESEEILTESLDSKLICVPFSLIITVSQISVLSITGADSFSDENVFFLWLFFFLERQTSLL